MNLNDLLKKAENATTLPKDPVEGIPPQHLFPWIRWGIRLIWLPFLYLELLTEKTAKLFIRPPFLQLGECKRRGNCCHYILFPETKGILKKLFLFWNTEVHGFYKRQGLEYEVDEKKIHVYGCRYLRKNGTCSNHFFRPKVCRSWPLISHFGYPKVLKGCGYQIKLRSSYAKKYPGLKIYEEK
ncbi:MAG: YkgJ family cysteine cluster protein [Verrucomicrobia bacterium]|nr:YkgJ family cysteine cluster protein [Verrucomicrobiota bacterium]